MRHGLPVITADLGGPASIVDNASGIRIPVTEPGRFAQDIAASLRQLAENPALRKQFGDGARAKIEQEGLWSAKASKIIDLYKEIIVAP
mgnify:CR=1 FL=1